MSDWWKKGVAFPSDNPNFIKILDFYLFNCPVKFLNTGKVVSQRAIIFEDTDWRGNNLTTLLSEMKRNITYCPLTSNDNVEIERQAVEGNEQYIVFVENVNLKKTKTIFYAVRNAFAHGSFSVVNNQKNPIYYLESAKEGKIKAQIKIYENTLLEWIELFNTPIDEVRKAKKERRNMNQKRRTERGKVNEQTNQ